MKATRRTYLAKASLQYFNFLELGLSHDVDGFQFHFDCQTRSQLFAKGNAGLGPFTSDCRLITGILEQLVVVGGSCGGRQVVGRSVDAVADWLSSRGCGERHSSNA